MWRVGIVTIFGGALLRFALRSEAFLRLFPSPLTLPLPPPL